MKIRFKKLDVIIVIILIVVSSLVLYKADYISLSPTKPVEENKGNETVYIPPPELPESLIPGYMKSVSAEDEGVHFDKIRICREWWYWSAALNGKNSELKNWTVAISFNHMARNDLLGTLKPDLLVVTLHGPNGEEYGGMINKKRGLGLFDEPTLKAKSPGVDLEFEDSWAEGRAPNWHIHAEDDDIDKDHELIIDLDYFAPSDPLWTIGDRAFDKSKSNIASYMFTGCDVAGTIKIDGVEYKVSGVGHHEHSWSPNVITKKAINGWDWCYMSFDNGWNIYFANYYPRPQALTSKTPKTNPFGSLVITTNQGNTLTVLSDIDLEIVESDEKIFPFVEMPTKFSLTGKPGALQPLLSTYDIRLDLDMKNTNTYEKIWKFPTYVGMKVGMNKIDGKISWNDDDGYHEIELNGIGAIWSMRALF